MEETIFKKQARTGPVLFAEYKRGDGIKKALEIGRENVLMELKDSKLKGRGGAGFPTATKWMLTAAANSKEKFLVCNADEGEPGTFKDRVLLCEYPELVFDGMVIGGYTIGAHKGLVYFRGEYEYMLEYLQYYLADDKGRWYGKGFGDIHELKLPYRSNVFFPLKGEYTFTVQHGMRKEDLKGVYDIGIRIEKTGK